MFELIGLGLLATIFLLYYPYAMATAKHGAPFVPMEPEVVGRVLQLTKLKEGEVFFELGSGDGRIVIAAAMRGAQAYGIEIDWLRVIYSRLWIAILRLGSHAQIIHQNFFEVNLADADVVCTYLLEETNEQLEPKLKQELKPGTRVVSVGFQFPNWIPDRIDPRGTIYGPIYLYQI